MNDFRSRSGEADNGLYLQLFSVHGLIRGHDLELGCDADTGGQSKYVLELTRALSESPLVGQVDLVTRLVVDPRVSEDYAERFERINDKARIVRIEAGGKRYKRKELLWPHLDEFVDNVLHYLRRQGRLPDVVHGHYADAGYVAMETARYLALPFLFTGHSLGRVKMESLLEAGLSQEDIDAKYQMRRRIEVEEEVLTRADLVITSTRHEIDTSYGLYELPEMNFRIIPPGIDTDHFYPYYYDLDETYNPGDEIVKARVDMRQEIARFLRNPKKPLILAISRPDQRKNIAGLISAFGEDNELRHMANLAIFAGVRKDIAQVDENERQVLTEMLLLMDKYDLYGKLALPKKHDPDVEIPVLYRMAAGGNGVFVNPALSENFGLTLIEAGSSGLPVVSTSEGGPCEIIERCGNGLLVDPAEPREISQALKKILVNGDLWRELSTNGMERVREHYSWKAHTSSYLEAVEDAVSGTRVTEPGRGVTLSASHLAHSEQILISDIDHTLIPPEDEHRPPPGLQRLGGLLRSHPELAFGVATGRSLHSVCSVIVEHDLPQPDILVCSVGTEIYYGSDLVPDHGYRHHISYRWKPEEIRRCLRDLDFLESQEDEAQREFKISYYMSEGAERLGQVRQRLGREHLLHNLIYSHGRFLDILPVRASKGKAIQYLARKWDFAPENIAVSGDSGNDEEMIRSGFCGIVVGNHSGDLDHLMGTQGVYFAQGHYASGVLEGLEHFGFPGAKERQKSLV